MSSEIHRFQTFLAGLEAEKPSDVINLVVDRYLAERFVRNRVSSIVSSLLRLAAPCTQHFTWSLKKLASFFKCFEIRNQELAELLVVHEDLVFWTAEGLDDVGQVSISERVVAFFDDVVHLDGCNEPIAVLVDLPNLQVHLPHAVVALKLSEELKQRDGFKMLFLAIKNSCETRSVDDFLALVGLLQVDLVEHLSVEHVVLHVVDRRDVDADVRAVVTAWIS